MKFSKHEQHISQHITKVMQADNLNWSERLAWAVTLIAQFADRDDEGATKADLATVLNHGLDGLVAKGHMSKEGSTYSFATDWATAEPGKVAAEDPLPKTRNPQPGAQGDANRAAAAMGARVPTPKNQLLNPEPKHPAPGVSV